MPRAKPDPRDDERIAAVSRWLVKSGLRGHVAQSGNVRIVRQ